MCEKQLKCAQTYNLKYITTAHQTVANSNGLTPEQADLGDEPPAKVHRISVKMDANRYRINMVRWATECNLPLNFFSIECVRDVLSPLEEVEGLHTTIEQTADFRICRGGPEAN